MAHPLDNSPPSTPPEQSTLAAFARVKLLFAQVCDLPEAQRESALRLLEPDPKTIERVLAMLGRESRVLDAVNQSIVGLMGNLAGASTENISNGDKLGAWTLGSELGHGGMGTVFKAQRSDGHFEQTAAIKIIRGMATTEALARLAQERQILARLNHPNIARLLDGGSTPLAQPYLVMEYIEGAPIDRYCRHRRASGAVIAKLLLAVCEALEFAHQRLIVHCDLKPSNILVGNDGRVSLLDFGIASLLSPDQSDLDGVTRESGRIAYTPGFASPEQQQGVGISAATDLFGLGRVLQVLLEASPGKARSAAFETVQLTENVHNAAHSQAQTPMTWASTPLAAIVHKATHTNPALRYISASAFAEDLRRFLERRPVRAMGTNLRYRLDCYVRRNALPLAFAGLALLALLGGLLSTSLSLREARAQSSRAEIAGQRAERTTAFLSSILSGVDPEHARDLDKTLMREILETAASKAEKELAAEPQVLSAILAVIGQTYHSLGEYPKAGAYLQRALTLLPPALLRERLRLRGQIANANAALNTNKPVLSVYTAIHAESLAAFGPLDSDTLKAEQALVFQLNLMGEYSRAEKAGTDLQPRLEKILGPDHPTSMENLQGIAIARTELGEFSATEPILHTLIQRQTRILGVHNVATVSTQQSLAILYLRQKHFNEAVLLLRELHALASRYFGIDSFNAMNISALLASALRQNGQLAESGTYYALALNNAKKTYGSDNIITLNYELNYANYEIASNADAAALQRCNRIEASYIKAAGSEHPNVAELFRTQARALSGLHRTADALSKWQQALRIDRKVFGADSHPQIVEDLAGIAALQL